MRKRESNDMWAEMTKVTVAAEEERQRAHKQRLAGTRVQYYSALNEQVEVQKHKKHEDAAAEAKFSEYVSATTAAHRRAEEAKLAKKAEKAKVEFDQMATYNAELLAQRKRDEENRRREEWELLEQYKEHAVTEQRKLADKKRRAIQNMEETLRENARLQREKEEAARQAREQENRMIAAAQAAADAREAKRVADVRARQEAVKAKIAGMNTVVQTFTDVEQLSAQKAERERLEIERLRDESNRQRQAKLAALNSDVRSDIARQLGEHTEAKIMKKVQVQQDLDSVQSAVRQAEAAEQKRRAEQAQRMRMYREQLEHQIANDVKTHMQPDESELERRLNEKLLNKQAQLQRRIF
jgi:hypothetical protein